MKQVPRRTFVKTLGWAACALAGCARRFPQKHVVLILVDQLRYDVALAAMDGVNGRAAEGVCFHGMRAAAPWTYPSVISMFSGLYPQQHGANVHPTKDEHLNTFSDKVPLLHGVLKGLGYATSAFVTNPFLHKWNPFHVGYDMFDASFVGNAGSQRIRGDVFWKPGRMFGDTVNAHITTFYEGRALTKPEFTYVHYIDVHGPWRGAPFDKHYVSSVRFIDRKILELHDFFMERYNGDVVFAVTSDHGRDLPVPWRMDGDYPDRETRIHDMMLGYGAEFRIHKASVHDFNLRIPFYLLPGSSTPEGVEVSSVCSNVDVAPTLLAMAAQKEFPHDLAGQSLLPEMHGDASPDRTVYALQKAFGVRSDCVVGGNAKYMRHYEAETDVIRATRFFDLENDPNETRSLPFDSEDWEPLIREAEKPGEPLYEPIIDGDPLPTDTKEQLKALGYF